MMGQYEMWKRQERNSHFAVCQCCADEFPKSELNAKGECEACAQSGIAETLAEIQAEKEAREIKQTSPNFENSIEAFLCRD